MARTGDGSNDVLAAAISGIAEPFAMGLLFNSAAGTGTFMSLGTDADNNHSLLIGAGAGADPINARARGGGLNDSVVTSADFTTSVWNHGMAVFGGANDLRIYLNAGNVGTQTGGVSVPSAATHVMLLARSNGATPESGTFVAASVAEAFIVDLSVWPGADNTAKADAFIACCAAPLTARFSPLFIPRGLRHYWPMLGGHAAELDWVGGTHLTVTEATQAAHPPIIYPRRRVFPVILDVAPPGGLSIPIAMYHRMRQMGV